MNENNFIITITGPSQSGKSLVMDKMVSLRGRMHSWGKEFTPKKIKKYTTRNLRFEEFARLEEGKPADIQITRQIPDECDLVYQTYGVRYGLATKDLEDYLRCGISPVVVINDIRAVEEIRKVFSGKVLSLFLFRKIPELEDYKAEAKNRGNVSEQEIIARYEKAIAIYRTYIENISLFDHVILNAVEYMPGELESENTILDLQLENVIRSVLDNRKMLRKDEKHDPQISRIFVIAGNAASGKDEIIRSLLSMGKLEAEVLPKYAMRQQEPEDGREMICRYIPSREKILSFREAYVKQKNDVEETLAKVQKSLGKDFQKQFLEFRQQLDADIKDEYQRFWAFLSEQMKGESEKNIIKKFFGINPDYVDLSSIKTSSEVQYRNNGVEVCQNGDKKYLIYGNDSRLYGCDITDVQRKLEMNKRHLVIVASDINVVNALKYLYGENRVRFIYAHSEISASEFEANASDITKKQKRMEFEKILDQYTKHISDYDHVTIYAKAKLTYEQTSKEEELVDQMFRLLRAY